MAVSQRFNTVDALRGFAVVLMVVYHFCYDLTYFRFALFDFYNNEFWLQSRNLIVTLFVFLSGSSLYFATIGKVRWKKYLNRLFLIIFLALLISVVTFYLFPGRTVFFGILHFIAAASVLGLLFRNLSWLNLILGIVFIISPAVYQHHFFDNTWYQWLGFVTYKPKTEDYVPIFPWFGVFLLGMYSGQLITRTSILKRWATLNYESKLYTWVKILGRHSLLIYMLHQPVLMGILYVFWFLMSK